MTVSLCLFLHVLILVNKPSKLNKDGNSMQAKHHFGDIGWVKIRLCFAKAASLLSQVIKLESEIRREAVRPEGSPSSGFPVCSQLLLSTSEHFCQNVFLPLSLALSFPLLPSLPSFLSLSAQTPGYSLVTEYSLSWQLLTGPQLVVYHSSWPEAKWNTLVALAKFHHCLACCINIS